jgi:hypothetical protein
VTLEITMLAAAPAGDECDGWLSPLPIVSRDTGPIQADVQPELCFHSQKPLKAQRSVGRHSTFLIDDLLQALATHSQPFRNFVHCKAKRFEKLFQEHFPGMRRRAMSWDA